MKKCVIPILVFVLCCVASCATKYCVYDVSKYFPYDSTRASFVEKLLDDDEMVLVVSPTDYIVHSDAVKVDLRRMSPQREHSGALFSDVWYKGRRYRWVEYVDDGYYDEGRRTYILYDAKSRMPVFGVAVDEKNAARKVGKEAVMGILSDPEIASQLSAKPKKDSMYRVERMYLFSRGF